MAKPAEQAWQLAKKAYQSIQKKLQRMDQDNGRGSEVSEFDQLEHLLEDLRLRTMQTIFEDLKFAHENDAEDRLWQAHVAINNEYRKRLSGLQGHGHVVVQRNLEKQYSKHLKTAQYFYRGFIERLSARYRLPQLQRIAHCLEAASLSVGEVVDAATASLDAQVTLSCHRTLLRLGDLSRYRTKQARQKARGSEMTLTYYRLAHDVLPTSGDAHHQIAVFLGDEKKDFDIVYHFYRAWAVRNPHQLVSRNLASEFQSVLSPSSQARGKAAPDPRHTFASWFVRLHARFFAGETFSQQDELEREVLHRFETLLTTPANLPLLQKAMLANISAYHVALKKVQKEWTESNSQSCQFILRFIIRTILAIGRTTEAELRSTFDCSKPVEEGTDSAAADSLNDETVLETTIPLLRIAMAWIYASRGDLVKFKEHLDPYVSDMHETLTQSLSMFIEAYSQSPTGTSPYLLPEDAETVGLIVLDDWPALRVDPNGEFKPLYDEPGVQRKSLEMEKLARIYDIVDRAVQLVGDNSFPWVLNEIQRDGKSVTTIAYPEGYQPSEPLVVPQGQDLDNRVDPPTSEAGHLVVHMDQLPTAGPAAVAVAPAIVAVSQESHPTGPLPEIHPPIETEFQMYPLDTDLNLDMEMYSRVENFLAPPESTRRPPQNEGETSYGMSTSLAEEAFRQMQPKSPSTLNKTFPSLPWNLVYTPTPNRTSQQDVAMAPPHGARMQANNASSGHVRSLDGSLPTVPDVSWAFTETPTDGHSSMRHSNSQQGLAPSFSNPSPMAGGISPVFPGVGGGAFGEMPGTPGQAGDHNPMSGNIWGPRGSGSMGNVNTMGGGSSFSMNFTQNSGSSLPQVQSPRGLPGAQTMAFRQESGHQRLQSPQHTALSQATQNLSPSAQENLSSNWYHASTGWGRGDIAPKDDPTHFRNAIGETHAMDETREYDRNALLSAFKGDDKPRRR